MTVTLCAPCHFAALPCRGQYYLLDEATGLLYHDASLKEWPELVGRVSQTTGTVHPLGADGATKFFTQLDAWLRKNKASREDGIH
jgi:hypothetical protein